MGVKWSLIVGFDLRFSSNVWCQASFPVLIGHLNILFEEVSIWYFLFVCLFVFGFFLLFLGPHMEVPRLGVELEL